MRIRFMLAVVFAVLFAGGAALAAGDKKDAGSEVLATVNGVPITEAERDRAIRLALRRHDDLRASEDLKKQVLDELITLTLIEQRLTQNGSLKLPSVQDELEFARRNALKNIFVLQTMGQKTDVKVEDIDRFVAEHPDYFANRKTFYYSDLKITREPRIDVARIKGFVLSGNSKTPEQNKATGGPLAQVIGYVKAVGGESSSFRGYRSSEQIAPDLFKDLNALTPGKVAVNETAEKGYIHVLELLSAQPDPADPVQMRSQIAQGMAAERGKKAVDNLLAMMRAEAEIKLGADAAKAVRQSPVTRGVAEASPGEFQAAPIEAKIALGWVFALIALVPAALYWFHRRTVAQRADLFLVDEDTLSAIQNRAKLFSHAPLFEIVLALTAVAFFLATSRFILQTGLPMMTGNAAAVLAAMALTVSLAVCAVLFFNGTRLPASLVNNRWAPLAVAALLQIAAILAVETLTGG